MKYSIGIIVVTVACLAYASNAEVLEEKLSLIETKTAKFLSGKEQITAGYKNLPPEIRKIACEAYPIASDKKTIKKLKKDLGFFEKKKNREGLSSEQITRLSSQKETIHNLKPGVNCDKLD